MIKKGDRIDILPQWQDAGDQNYVWVATDDEENGRITICPISMPISLKPCSTVEASMITLREAGFVSNILKDDALAKKGSTATA
jgi:hypothetical protein